MTKTQKVILAYKRQKNKNVSELSRKFGVRRQTIQKYLQLGRVKGLI